MVQCLRAVELIVDYNRGLSVSTLLVIHLSYTDKQLAGGKIVTPNQSYTPARML